MNIAGNYYIKLILLTLIIVLVELIISLSGIASPVLIEMLIPTIVFFIISILSLFVFSLGSKFSNEIKPLFSLAAIGSKFFLSACYALVQFTALKNTDTGDIILFFLLYLTFSFYVLRIILKVLKIKSLTKD